MSSLYWAMIGDVVRSRQIRNRAAFQQRFERVVQEINHQFSGRLASRGRITTGDEVQFLFSSPKVLCQVTEALYQQLHPYKIRFGIGYGELSTELKSEAIGMDGPAWHAARFALETARKDRRRVVVAAGEEILNPVSDIWNLALHVAMSRTWKQQEIVRLYDRMRKQTLVAGHLGLDHSVVSRHLQKALYWEVKQVTRHIPQLMEDAVRQRPMG